MREKKQKIYASAASMFKEKGYLATSMRDLAESVGLEPSSLYSHIRSKEEILRSICIDTGKKFLNHAQSLEDAQIGVLKKIESLIRFHIKTALEDSSSITVFNDEWRNLSEPILTDFISMRKAYEALFLTILKQGIQTGEIKALNPTIMMHTILSAVKWVHYWHRKNDVLNAHILEDELASQLLSGIKNDGP